MSDDHVTILDHLDSIRVPGRVFDHPVNEYWALVCLWEGLEFLQRQAEQCDELARQSLGAPPGTQIDAFGNDPAFAAVPIPLLTSAFHWYAVSACQYVRTVGAIAKRFDQSRPKPVDYVVSVIPRVLRFRDKVAAHFAWATQNAKDNEAERTLSVMPPLGFFQDSFHVGVFSLFARRGAETSAFAMGPWSICDTHSRLRERYWPLQDPNPRDEAAR